MANNKTNGTLILNTKNHTIEMNKAFEKASCIIGSGIAGALSMVFGCTLMAPHGGIFVFPVVGNWPMYIVALVIGTVVGTFLLGFLKKPVEE